MPPLLPAKPFKSYEELLEILVERGMRVEDRARAKRKLAQVGYYRLSGFWYPCREIAFDDHGHALKESMESPWRLKRKDTFLAGTSFNAVFDLYLFDKKLRLLMIDALERIEIFMRSVIAHELGRVSPLAYQDGQHILDRYKQAREDRPTSPWQEWHNKQQRQIAKSKDDCILWHLRSNKEIPFWVAIETWDFGMMTQYYNMLSWKHKNRICDRIDGALRPALGNWMISLNILRNKCAHHARIWNMRVSTPVQLVTNAYFDRRSIDDEARHRLCGFISIIWYLIKTIGPSSDWIGRVADTIQTMPALPNCTYRAMGFPNPHELPSLY